MKRISLLVAVIILTLNAINADSPNFEAPDQLQQLRDQLVSRNSLISLIPNTVLHISDAVELDGNGASLEFSNDEGAQIVVEPGGTLLLKNIHLINYRMSSIEVMPGGTLAFGSNVSFHISRPAPEERGTRLYGFKPTTALHLQREREREKNGGPVSQLTLHEHTAVALDGVQQDSFIENDVPGESVQEEGGEVLNENDVEPTPEPVVELSEGAQESEEPVVEQVVEAQQEESEVSEQAEETVAAKVDETPEQVQQHLVEEESNRPTHQAAEHKPYRPSRPRPHGPQMPHRPKPSGTVLRKLRK